jgi:hypothetical protein
MLEHMSWAGDSLVISLPKQKNDQEGSRNYPRHIYANSEDPAICPILALGIIFLWVSFFFFLLLSPVFFFFFFFLLGLQIFSKPFRTSNRLFEGDEQEHRYGEILTKTLQKLTNGEETILGAKKEKIGTHSSRKGAVTYCNSLSGGATSSNVKRKRKKRAKKNELSNLLFFFFSLD